MTVLKTTLAEASFLAASLLANQPCPTIIPQALFTGRNSLARGFSPVLLSVLFSVLLYPITRR